MLISKDVLHKLPPIDGYCEECQEELSEDSKKVRNKSCHFCSKYYQSFKFGEYPVMCQGCGQCIEKRGMYRSCFLCGKCWAEKLCEEKRKKLNEHQEKVKELQQTEISELTFENYSEIKKIANEVKKLDHQYESKPFKSELEEFIKEISELENKFPEKIKLKYRGKNKSKDCSHQNIEWKDFFKKDKSENAYCLDCGDEESKRFSESLQRWYYKKITEWLREKDLKTYEFNNFLRQENYYDVWSDVQRGRFEGAVSNFLEQATMWKIAENIEDYCLEFAKSKGINTNKKLQQSISNLANKPNKTLAEETELANLRKKLEELNKTEQSKEPDYKPLIIGASFLVAGIIISALLFSKKKK
ncbi:hypothetical protein [endosymbiont GvMRE of Glomus versiforme]|uniref:hypothetical protein n=1 Tax=endosymbiont GvMRE of Glomus versiforme TaxID=2039283 RepID=UPI000EE2FFDE|nr:hypothetical protein [endosymbiont GvMRE of Glomus versiforme]RHZ35676.1 hypothetical protein GvMRE_IIg25 [endosymbiont GvMRE of Glomus versiforme]